MPVNSLILKTVSMYLYTKESRVQLRTFGPATTISLSISKNLCQKHYFKFSFISHFLYRMSILLSFMNAKKKQNRKIYKRNAFFLMY